MVLSIVALLISPLVALPSLAPAGAAPGADEIFAAMRSALLARHYPPEISYGVAVEHSDANGWSGRTYDSFAFPAKDEIRVRTVSREENAHPADPKGFAISIAGFGSQSGDDADDLGIPRLSPAYAFGLVPAPVAPPVVPQAVASGTPETIGSVSAVAKIYDVALAGSETVNGSPCWHLTLKPLGNPGKYRVRDVWVTQSDAQLVRLRTDGNFTSPSTGKGLWTVDYARADGGEWYISSETSPATIGDDGRPAARTRVRFIDVRPDPREIYDVGVASETLQILQEP